MDSVHYQAYFYYFSIFLYEPFFHSFELKKAIILGDISRPHR